GAVALQVGEAEVRRLFLEQPAGHGLPPLRDWERLSAGRRIRVAVLRCGDAPSVECNGGGRTPSTDGAAPATHSLFCTITARALFPRQSHCRWPFPAQPNWVSLHRRGEARR